MKTFSGISLKNRLYTVVLIAFIPASILAFFVVRDQRIMERGTIMEKALIFARAAAAEESRQMESYHQLLSVISGVLPIMAGNPDLLAMMTGDLIEDSRDYAAFGVTDSYGHLISRFGLPESRSSLGNSSWFETCLERKAFTVGPYRGETINGRPVLYLSLPATDNRGSVTSVAFTAVYLNWMNRNLFRSLSELPEGSILFLRNTSGNSLMYDAESMNWKFHRDFEPSLLKKMMTTDSGILTGPDANGISRIYAFASLSRATKSHQDLVVLAVPRKLAFKTSRLLFIRNIVLLSISAMLAIGVIWWAGDRLIIRRVATIVNTTRRLAAGDLNARIVSLGARDELHHLARIFNKMAKSLQERITKEEKIRKSLESSKEKLRRLSAHQQKVRETERIRIAREIHDQLGQSLTILKMDLSWLTRHCKRSDHEITKKIAAMAGVIDTSLKSLHEVTSELRPIILDDFGLAAAVEWQLDQFQERSRMDCRIENNCLDPKLSDEQTTALFRIFQEILTNILRHANADTVEVCLIADKSEFTMAVRDNGRGIRADEINDHESFGLMGMRERLYPWNGRVTFEGSPGMGTLVTIRVPLQSQGEPK